MAKSIQDITLSDIICAYNGASGCACGCNGDYFTTKENAKLAGENRGYDYDPENINDGAVLHVLRMIQGAEFHDKIEVLEGSKRFGTIYAWEKSASKVYRIYCK